MIYNFFGLYEVRSHSLAISSAFGWKSMIRDERLDYLDSIPRRPAETPIVKMRTLLVVDLPFKISPAKSSECFRWSLWGWNDGRALIGVGAFYSVSIHDGSYVIVHLAGAHRAARVIVERRVDRVSDYSRAADSTSLLCI